jgi:1-aminocyclopropane-1-carboxylate deaminase/D-cysteine desulfhydrase-like pyridoxal-dependent ACC family enzyme
MPAGGDTISLQVSAANSRTLQLGGYPTPIVCAGEPARSGCVVWVKRDDLTHPVYGGNKVRKLEHLLGEALAAGARRIVTVGSVGSHHVLATTYFGRLLGLEVEGVLVGQPFAPYVGDVLRAGVGLGLRAFPAGSWASVPLAVARRVARGARPIAIGGSSVSGSMGYVEAARELARQVRAGEAPEPDLCVVGLGTGGTVAGLAAGFEAEGLRTRVVGVLLSHPAQVLEAFTRYLAAACAARAGASRARAASNARLEVERRFLGAGYGHPTREGTEATHVAREAAGIILDPTYTAKAFAGALDRARRGKARHILYWHTLSSAPIAPLLVDAPPLESLDPRLRRLLTSAN